MSRVFAVVAGVLLGACTSEGSTFKPLQVGDRVPEYGARSLDGDSVNLSELSGRPVLINIWATWCGPCREEMPELQELADRYQDQLQVVGVSIDRRGSERQIRHFVEEIGADFRILTDPEEQIVRRFRTIGVPESFLIDADGVLRHRWIGRFSPLAADNTRLIRAVIAEESS